MERRWSSAIDAMGALRHSPVARFVLIGALLFAGERAWRRLLPERETITLSAADVAQLRVQWTAQHDGEAPSADDERRMIERAVDEEILAREALRLDIDRGDRLVRDRLAKLGAFLALSPGATAEALEGEARSLGLERDDPVIRRYLVHLMEIGLAGPARPPSEEEVRARYARLAAKFEAQPRLRFSQIYLGRDAHRGALPDDARRLLDELRAAGAGPEAAKTHGDPFAAGAQIGPASAADLERLFGADFAAAVEAAPSREWWGPVSSSYGLHLVWIEARFAARGAELEEMRNQIAWELIRENQDRRREERLRDLRARYRVVVEDASTS